jgi:hypothetical protein
MCQGIVATRLQLCDHATTKILSHVVCLSFQDYKLYNKYVGLV